ncbi:MAG: DNA repair protein RecO [Desulfarculaceae bacterium]|nr:DNA repair protein RecO [Desulfarculaceae bacterium]MCF8073441.1 DNA repair protein RecO [Desulfarculaceae bacterium]MCF8100412.1 DNA repair protein RecO [Desulfarculaceae bacterium]MCF8115852.1 DNA repair protein RecO [Desulfarculaceae bacterium]
MLPPASRGLVLRLRSLGESDLLVDLFTRRLGRLTAVAKGGKRSKQRFFGVLLAGHLLEMELAPTKSADLWRMESARVREAHVGLRSDYTRLMAAGPVLELLLKATPVQAPQPGALELALATLARLEKSGDPSELGTALVIFLVRLLDLLGYGLNLDSCLHCGRQIQGAVNGRLSLGGGLTCSSCPPGQRDHPAPPGLIKSLQAAARLEPQALGRLRLPPERLREALAFLSEFWQEIVGNDLPSLGLAVRTLAHGNRRRSKNGPPK